jgi:hypothetical protein
MFGFRRRLFSGGVKMADETTPTHRQISVQLAQISSRERAETYRERQSILDNDDDDDDESYDGSIDEPATTRLGRNLLAAFVGIAVISLAVANQDHLLAPWSRVRSHETTTNTNMTNVSLQRVPLAFVQHGIFSESDFVNEPPFWNNCEENPDGCFPITTSATSDVVRIGPCFSSKHTDPDYWETVIQNKKDAVEYPPASLRKVPTSTESTALINMCRPGFLIIGAGKCGTSSLYQYLVSHPRVLPASTKQIHYFRVSFLEHWAP